jgi:hypothetical protein
MTLEEALKVTWFRTNPKPIGVLLNEGFLDEKKLEWASQNSYVPTVKEASLIVLEALKNQSLVIELTSQFATNTATSIPVKLSWEQARAVEWKFASGKGQPLGKLIDSKQIGMKDLGYAIENAFDERLREASKTLLVYLLQQDAQLANKKRGFLNLKKVKMTYSEEQQFKSLLYAGMALGSSMAVPFFILWQMSVASRPAPEPQTFAPIVVIFSLAFLVAMCAIPVLIGGKISDYFIKRFIQFRRGRKGEEQVASIISQVLDDEWYLFCNLVLPNYKGDIDAILVSKAGIWALEIKIFAGNYRNIGDEWAYFSGQKWRTIPSPSQQARRNAGRVAEFLKTAGIKEWVEPIVVWANGEDPLHFENPSVTVWSIARLPDELGNIWLNTKLSDDNLQKVVEKLTQISEKNDKA